MNSQILFRGKHKHNKKWMIGNGIRFITDVCKRQTVFIYGIDSKESDWCEVDPKAVGQFTGLTDANGANVFEGDVMEFDAYGIHYTGTVNITNGNTGIHCGDADPFLSDAIIKYCAVVIGNIYDNPELLGGAS